MTVPAAAVGRSSSTPPNGRRWTKGLLGPITLTPVPAKNCDYATLCPIYASNLLFLPDSSRRPKGIPFATILKGDDFVIVNGTRRFNRALYGTHTLLRVEASDLPEFALYIPGLGPQSKLGVFFRATNTSEIHFKVIKAGLSPPARCCMWSVTLPWGKAAPPFISTLLALSDAEGSLIPLLASNTATGRPANHCQ